MGFETGKGLFEFCVFLQCKCEKQRGDNRIGFPLFDLPFFRVIAVGTAVDVPFLLPYACASSSLRSSLLFARGYRARLRSFAQKFFCAFPHCFAMRKITPIRLRARRQPPRIRRQFNVCGFSFRPAGREKHWRGRYACQAVGRAKRQSEALAREGRRSFLQ